MSNITAFLPKSVANRMEMQPVADGYNLDFSITGAASGDTVEVCEIPVGMMVTKVILAVHTTEATVTVAVGDEASGTQFLGAQTLTDIKADNTAGTLEGAVASLTATQKFNAETGKKLVLTIGGAAVAAANISVKLCGYLVAKTNYEGTQTT